MKLYLLFFIFIFSSILLNAQNTSFKGKISYMGKPVEFANIALKNTKIGTFSDENGNYSFQNVPLGTYIIQCSAIGFEFFKTEIKIKQGLNNFNFELTQDDEYIEEVVVTGTMKETYIKNSPIKVLVLSPDFLQKSPTNNIIEAIQTVNGVQEQINCGVCGTNDIHINGMEGPYTLLLIDGMPIVSALASTYGFNGIPNSIIKRVEIVKGPASSLYGTEAVGGVINIITKDAMSSPRLSYNSYITSHLEFNTDVATSFKVSKNVSSLLSANYYYNQYRIDFNNDNFTDIPLNNRLSIFNKWNFKRKKNRKASLAIRYYTENRFGGELDWEEKNRGDSLVYGESIYTNRIEVIGSYQLPTTEKLRIDYSLNHHDQNSYYGKTLYDAQQSIAFANMIWDKSIKKHDFLVGGTFRYQIYNDNTPATLTAEKHFIPGLFIQDEIKIKKNSSLLLGGRLDYHKNYGLVPAPRIAYKFKPGNWTTVRFNFGKGFRLVNLFTEDHAALTGSRTVVVKNDLKPEQTYNGNININRLYLMGESMGTIDFDLFYTYFSNKIIPDYQTDQNLIIYDNLGGNAIVRGISLSVEQKFIKNRLAMKVGGTYQDVFEIETDKEGTKTKTPQIFTPKFSGTFVNSYKIKKYAITLDWTGKIMGTQELPIYSVPFERETTSPWFSIQNLQVTKEFKKNSIKVYAGVKNIWNYTQDTPLIDPENPFGKNFDTAYAYGPLQTRRFFIGVRMELKKER